MKTKCSLNYSVHSSQPEVPDLNRTYPVHAPPIYLGLFKIHFILTFHIRKLTSRYPVVSCLHVPRTKLCMHFSHLSYVLHTQPIPLNHRNTGIKIYTGQKYLLRSETEPTNIKCNRPSARDVDQISPLGYFILRIKTLQFLNDF